MGPREDNPLNEYYKYPAGSEDLWCEAIKSLPIENRLSNGQMPQYCGSSNPKVRCCTTSHEVYIKKYVQEGGLFPNECARKKYEGLRELACLACEPRQPEYTTRDPDNDN